MLTSFLMLGDAGVANPSLGSVSVSFVSGGGLCGGGGCTTVQGSQDKARVSWSITGANTFYFETKVYRNDVLWTTLSNTDTTEDDSLGGSEGWMGDPVNVNNTYRVDVVRKETGEVVSTQTSSAFTRALFTNECPGPC